MGAGGRRGYFHIRIPSAKNGDEGVRGRRPGGGWEGCAGVAREFATRQSGDQNAFERRGTADLIAKSLNNYPVNTLHACKRRARRAHAQASSTPNYKTLSNGKLNAGDAARRSRSPRQ